MFKNKDILFWIPQLAISMTDEEVKSLYDQFNSLIMAKVEFEQEYYQKILKEQIINCETETMPKFLISRSLLDFKTASKSFWTLKYLEDVYKNTFNIKCFKFCCEIILLGLLVGTPDQIKIHTELKRQIEFAETLSIIYNKCATMKASRQKKISTLKADLNSPESQLEINQKLA